MVVVVRRGWCGCDDAFTRNAPTCTKHKVAIGLPAMQ
jgi:hypothetical protein